MSNKPRSVSSSIWNMKCARCREGDLFETGSFSFSKPFQMPEKCDRCGQLYLPAPGFYYGAMFISYAIQGWFGIFLMLSLVYIFDWHIDHAFILFLFISAIFFVWSVRISRSIWFHISEKYDPKAIEKYNQK